MAVTVENPEGFLVQTVVTPTDEPSDHPELELKVDQGGCATVYGLPGCWASANYHDVRVYAREHHVLILFEKGEDLDCGFFASKVTISARKEQTVRVAVKGGF